MSKRKRIMQEANPETATSTGVRTVWALVALCGLVLTPIAGPVGLGVIGVGIIGFIIG